MARTLIPKSQLEPLDITNSDISSSAAIDTSKLAEGDNFIQKDGSVTFEADQSIGGFKLTNLADGVNPSDAVTVSQLSSVTGTQYLEDLLDVNVAAMTNWQFLRYDTGSSKWVNSSLSVASEFTWNTTTGTLSIRDGAADGITKGIVAFANSDFESGSGIISIDFNNTQKANASQPGVLTAADWIRFDAAATGGISLTDLSATSPLDYNNTTGVFSIASGYMIPTSIQIGNWNTAYNSMITSASFNTSDGVITLTKQDASTITVDIDGRFSSLGHTHTTSDITDWSTAWDTKFSGKTTDNLTEGVTNLYYTNARFDTRFATKTTTDLTEGTNLYFTNSRARLSISETITGIDYDNATGIFSLTSGYVIPTTTQETNWNTAYTNRITSLTTTGSSGAATLISNTLNIPNYTASGLGALTDVTVSDSSEIDFTVTSPTATTRQITGSLITGSIANSKLVNSSISFSTGSTGTAPNWSSSPVSLGSTATLNIPLASGTAVTSGTITKTEYDNFTTAYTNRITSLTTTGSSGAATLSSNTLNIPNYTLTGLGGVPTTRTLTINGTALDLSADRSWSVGTVTTVGVTDSSEIDFTVTNATTTPNITASLIAGSIANSKLTNSTISGISLGSNLNSLTITTPLTGTSYNGSGAVTLGLAGLTTLGTANRMLGMNSGATGYEYKTLAVGTSGTDFAIAHTTNTVTFNLPTASATNRGALSSANWTTFNNKIGGSGSVNFIPYFSGASTLTSSPIQTDGSNIGIGIAASASYRITTNGVINATGYRATNNDGLVNVTNTTINIITNSGTGITYNNPAGGYLHTFKEGTTSLMVIGNNQVLVNKTSSSSYTFDVNGTINASTSVTTPLLVNTGTLTLPTVTSTVVTYKTSTTTSSATPTPTGDAWDNRFSVTALATNPTFAAPSGTPVDGNTLIIRIKDNGTARTLAWNAIYRAGTDFALPTTTVINKTMYVQFVYNSADSKWDLIGKTDGF